MSDREKLQHLAISAFIATSLASYSTSSVAGDDIFELKETPKMQRCYWLSRTIPAEGLCGEKMRPDTDILKDEAKKGNSIAALRLGQLYSSGNWGINQDLNQAIEWFTHAAELGDRYSQLQLGNAYEFGRMGVERNIKTAIKFYRMATENGIYPDLEEKIERLEKRVAQKN